MGRPMDPNKWRVKTSQAWTGKSFSETVTFGVLGPQTDEGSTLKSFNTFNEAIIYAQRQAYKQVLHEAIDILDEQDPAAIMEFIGAVKDWINSPYNFAVPPIPEDFKRMSHRAYEQAKGNEVAQEPIPLADHMM